MIRLIGKEHIAVVVDDDFLSEKLNIFLKNAPEKIQKKFFKSYSDKINKITIKKGASKSDIYNLVDVIYKMLHYTDETKWYKFENISQYSERVVTKALTRSRVGQVFETTYGVQKSNLVENFNYWLRADNSIGNIIQYGIFGIPSLMMGKLPIYLPVISHSFQKDATLLTKKILQNEMTFDQARTVLIEKNYNKLLVDFWYGKTQKVVALSITTYVSLTFLENVKDKIQVRFNEYRDSQKKLNDVRDQLRKLNQEMSQDMGQLKSEEAALKPLK